MYTVEVWEDGQWQPYDSYDDPDTAANVVIGLRCEGKRARVANYYDQAINRS